MMGEEQHRRPSIATIFNPRRSKGSNMHRPRPSVVVTDEDTSNPSILTNGGEVINDMTPRSSLGGGPSVSLAPIIAPTDNASGCDDDKKKGGKCSKLRNCIFSVTTRKIVCGIFVTFTVTTTRVGMTHLLKDLFLMTRPPINMTDGDKSMEPIYEKRRVFDAPLFVTWFCTAWVGLFFPLYLMGCACLRHNNTPVQSAMKSIAQKFRDRNVTFGKFCTRCLLFCGLWVGSFYTYVYSLQILHCTDVMALYSVHIAFVYLLSWVVLHEQFVGVRIVAFILCNTGIALLAYMDGITKTETLLGVVLAATSAAAAAVYKVLFKKVLGNVSFGQMSLFFTCIAFLSTLLLSPIVAVLFLTEHETILWMELPWLNFLLTSLLSFVSTLLQSFGTAITFELFVTLGIIGTVPVSAALDVKWYHVIFEGMKLAGIVLIVCGFFLVLFPTNWPQFITKLLRWGRHRKRHHQRQHQEPIDYRTGLISRSHLRSPSGLIR